MAATKRSPVDDESAVLEAVLEKIRGLTEQMRENNRQLDRLLGSPVEPRPKLSVIEGGRDDA